MEELTPDQLDTLIARLREERAELADLLARSDDDAKPVDLDLPIGRLSRIDAIQQQKMAEASRAGWTVRLREIDAALKRVDDDEYGLCEECGDFISFRRLSARPESRLCLECQEAREQG